MSKKKSSVMEREKNAFIHGAKDDKGKVLAEGCVKKGVAESIANKVFIDMEEFTKYAFNKSHAAGYAIIAYQTAYLKAHYPVEFMAATMTSMMGSSSRIARYIQDCNKMKLEILPPDINRSFANFSVENGKIRYGLKSIKNVGRGIINSIVNRRPFNSFSDFCEKVDHKELNKRAVESFIKAGAFDNFKTNRAQLLASFDKTVDSIHNEKRRNVEGQLSLFTVTGMQSPSESIVSKMSAISELKEKVLLNFEKDVLGLYLSGHPLGEFKDLVERISIMNLSDLIESAKDTETQMIRDGSSFQFAGMVISKKNMTTKNGKIMAFIKVEDLYDSIEVIVFPKVYDRAVHLIREDSFVIISGKLNFKEDEDPKLLAENIMALNEENARVILSSKTAMRQVQMRKKEMNRKLYIKLETHNDNAISQITNILSKNKGKVPVIIYFADTKKKMIAPENLWVNSNDRLINDLKKFLGNDSVVLK